MPRLLIVDDEPNLLYSLTKVLRSDSLDIATAETARDGIDKSARLEARRRDPRRTAAGYVGPRCLHGNRPDRFATTGHHDHRLFDDGDGHRSDEARGLRVPAQAGRLRAASRGRAAGA